MSDVLLREIEDGAHCRIVTIEGAGCDNLFGFFADQQRKRGNDLKGLMRVIRRTAEEGPLRNKEKCRLLGDGIYEFKKGCLRVAWFWDKGNLIICTHGFVKKRGETPPGQIDRAKRIRCIYQEAKTQKRLRGQ